MDLYITEKETGTQIALSLLPDSVKTKTSTSTISYSFIDVGEVKAPNGQSLRQFSWSGNFLGESRSNLPFIKKQFYMAPKEIINIIEMWREKGTRLVLMLTETNLNVEVFLSSFNYEWIGGMGDAKYDITFTEAKDIIVMTTLEANISQDAQNTNISHDTRPASSSPPTDYNDGMNILQRAGASHGKGPIKTITNTNTEQTRTYIVQKGDCLWSIAKKFLGSGAKYTKIYEMNKEVIGSDPDLIYPGQVLILPC